MVRGSDALCKSLKGKSVGKRERLKERDGGARGVCGGGVKEREFAGCTRASLIVTAINGYQRDSDYK